MLESSVPGSSREFFSIKSDLICGIDALDSLSSVCWMRELVRLPFLFLYRILMPAGEFEMSGLERGHSDLTTSDSFLFERKERKEIVWRSTRTRGYLLWWNTEFVKRDLERYYYSHYLLTYYALSSCNDIKIGERRIVKFKSLGFKKKFVSVSREAVNYSQVELLEGQHFLRIDTWAKCSGLSLLVIV